MWALTKSGNVGMPSKYQPATSKTGGLKIKILPFKKYLLVQISWNLRCNVDDESTGRTSNYSILENFNFWVLLTTSVWKFSIVVFCYFVIVMSSMMYLSFEMFLSLTSVHFIFIFHLKYLYDSIYPVCCHSKSWWPWLIWLIVDEEKFELNLKIE